MSVYFQPPHALVSFCIILASITVCRLESRTCRLDLGDQQTAFELCNNLKNLCNICVPWYGPAPSNDVSIAHLLNLREILHRWPLVHFYCKFTLVFLVIITITEI